MTDVERLVREGFAELVKGKPDLGSVDAEAAKRARSPRTPVTRWLAVAAALVVLAGLGVGLWSMQGAHPGPRVVTAEPANPAPSLVETTWLLAQIEDEPAVVDSRGRVPNLRFEGTDVVRANDTCNDISGSYRLDGDRLSLTDLTTTARACQDRYDVLMQREEYRSVLRDVTRVALQGSTLTLFDMLGQPILVLKAAADPSPAPATTVQIRVRNDSAATMEDVRARFGHGTGADYGAIAPGQQSDYRNAGQAYRYAQIRAVVDGKDLVLQPKDYVGETPLPPGRYTYVLTAGRAWLDVRLEVDQ